MLFCFSCSRAEDQPVTEGEILVLIDARRLPVRAETASVLQFLIGNMAFLFNLFNQTAKLSDSRVELPDAVKIILALAFVASDKVLLHHDAVRAGTGFYQKRSKIIGRSDSEIAGSADADCHQEEETDNAADAHLNRQNSEYDGSRHGNKEAEDTADNREEIPAFPFINRNDILLERLRIVESF